MLEVNSDRTPPADSVCIPFRFKSCFGRWSCTVPPMHVHPLATLCTQLLTLHTTCAHCLLNCYSMSARTACCNPSHTMLHSSAALSCCSHTQPCDTLCCTHSLLHCCHSLLLLCTTLYSVVLAVVCHFCRVLFAATRVCYLTHSSSTVLPFSHPPADESLNTAVRAKTGSRHSAVTQHCTGNIFYVALYLWSAIVAQYCCHNTAVLSTLFCDFVILCCYLLVVVLPLLFHALHSLTLITTPSFTTVVH